VALGLVLVVSAVTLGSALRGDGGSSTADPAQSGPEPASRLVQSGPPKKEALALLDGVTLFVPVEQSRITTILYHPIEGVSTLELTPLGRRLDAGIIDRLEARISGGSADGPEYHVRRSPGSVDIGAPPGTRVFAPADGTVVGITPNVIDGDRWGHLVAIQPARNPSVVVTVSHVEADDGLTVGDTVVAGTTLLGSVVDMAPVLDQELRDYTQDVGNHVHVEATPSTNVVVP
jgi:murein DD-endopeptidase MepM/ murein hydrolase activator NlpD